MYNELSRKVLLTSDQVGLYLASTHQMAPPGTHPEIRPAAHLSTPEEWKAELA